MSPSEIKGRPKGSSQNFKPGLFLPHFLQKKKVDGNQKDSTVINVPVLNVGIHPMRIYSIRRSLFFYLVLNFTGSRSVSGFETERQSKFLFQ